MTVTDTSIESYYDAESQSHFETQRDWILHCIKNAYRPSISDISRISKVAKSSVTGRLNELEKEGLIHKADKKKDPFTGKTVYWYAIGKGESQ